MATVPIFSPDGSLGDIPQDQLVAAVRAGAKPGIHITAPDGSPGVIPADRVPDAAKAGAKIVPIENQPVQHPGFWAAFGSDLGGMAKGTFNTLGAAMRSAASGSAQPLADQASQTAQTISDNMQHRRDEGRSLPYRTIAPVGDVLGVNTRGMEDAADQGDVGGVAGHAAAVPAVMAASEGLSHGAGPVADAAAPAVRAAVKTINKGLQKLPEAAGGAAGFAAGHATGIPEAGLAGAWIGRSVGKDLLPTLKLPGERFGLPPEEIEAPDATAENKPYAGDPKPKLEKELDATNENKPFAGGMDEYIPPKKPVQSASAQRTVVLDPESGKPEFSDLVAAKQNAAQVVPQPKPAQAVVSPEAAAPAEAPTATGTLESRLSQLLDKAQEEAAQSKPEQDLMAPLQQMLDEVLKKKAAGVKPVLNRLLKGEAGQAGLPGSVADADEGIADIQSRPTVATKTGEVPARGFLNKVGADENSVLKTQKDLDSVFYHRQQIAQNGTPNVELHVDGQGNVIGAQGRHRALAAIQQGGPGAKVNVTIYKHPFENPE
jgi:hypothetical protein